jgi:spore maturation protein CgeB
MPPEENLKALDLVFTSFPHYRAREFPRMGVRSVFHRLAFSPLACARAGGRVPDRDIPVSFVGGLGGGAVGRGWWDRGTQALARLAEQGCLHWYGYGKENWNANCSLNGCWKGEAWGVDMYRVYLRSRIVVNRHGEVAEGSGNNMRQYEATGCGACLVTDEPGVFADGQECAVYRRPEDLPGLVAELLRDEPRRQRIAEAGHRATMGLHTYDVRAEALDEELRGLLGGS